MCLITDSKRHEEKVDRIKERHPFMVKILNKCGKEGNFLNLIKTCRKS